MRFLGLRLAAVLVVATTMGQASDKNGGPLNRVKRMLQGDTATTAATANAFISDHEIQDSWATDPILKGAKRLMNGDHAGLVLEMSLGKEVKEILSDPVTTHAMLQGKGKGEVVHTEQMKRQRAVARHSVFPPFPRTLRPSLFHSLSAATPLFNVLPGVKALSAKSLEEFTKADVSVKEKVK